jgi:hypothetical protein
MGMLPRPAGHASGQVLSPMWAGLPTDDQACSERGKGGAEVSTGIRGRQTAMDTGSGACDEGARLRPVLSPGHRKSLDMAAGALGPSPLRT